MKVAIVHDFLNQYGGAEKVVEVLHSMYPEAPIYTSIYDREHMPDSFKEMDIRVSFMQRLPGIFKHFKKYLVLYHAAFEMFNLNEYDLVISSSSFFSKCLRLNAGTCHICYCHTPARFIWMYEDYVKRESIHGVLLKLLPYIIKYLKKIDINSSRHVDYFIANSFNVASRIKEFYNRDAEVIYPPVEVQASGRPVIAYGAGGALETVVAGETGVFFNEQNVSSLIRAVKDFQGLSFNSLKIREHALKYDQEHFKKNFKEFVETKYKEYNHD